MMPPDNAGAASTPGAPLIEQIFAAARATVGHVTRIGIGSIHRRDVERFDVAVAGSTKDDILGLASELYLSSVLAWAKGPAEGALLPDGNAADPFAGFDVAGLRLMAGGQDLTFHRDLCLGTEVILEIALASADLKQIRDGRLLVLTIDRRYSDSEGLLVECRETFLGREGLE